MGINTALYCSIQERRHSRVKTWTRGVNLFEKDFIFVPINQMWVSQKAARPASLVII